jgi:hypothetical protein
MRSLVVTWGDLEETRRPPDQIVVDTLWDTEAIDLAVAPDHEHGRHQQAQTEQHHQHTGPPGDLLDKSWGSGSASWRKAFIAEHAFHALIPVGPGTTGGTLARGSRRLRLWASQNWLPSRRLKLHPAISRKEDFGPGVAIKLKDAISAILLLPLAVPSHIARWDTDLP